MVLAAAFIVPHGALILDASPSQSDGRYEVKQAMIQIANKITELNPDVIIITSPHGISLAKDFGLYYNEYASGSAEWNGEYQDYKVHVTIDLDFTKELLTYLENYGLPVDRIMAFSRREPIPLRWGETVPLWFLRDLSDLRYVFISQPQKKSQVSKDFISITVDFGTHLGKIISMHKKRIVVIISADLAHTHEKSGPYGHYKDAELFDRLVEKWIIGYNDPTLSSKIYSHLDKALCCGFTGMLMLQGILGEDQIRRKVLIRKSPTYYGMMVASFLVG
ncbi:MAG: hypothetical protein JW776_08945 [Candidatus Lokiarchaeota archaeon]|nr:hypothetical protein [Candidatus Lokiarchaeota archaeon]